MLENNQHLFQFLLENTSVGENRQSGEKSPTVRFADFATRDNNRFIAVCQFKVRVLGTEHHIIPDVVLFLNGMPVVVIECKSPKVKDAIPEAIDQLRRYSEQRGVKGEGNAPLFYYNQFVVATCRQEAKFGTITTHTEKYFYRWADPYPRTVDELDHGSGSPNDQQRLVAGMLDRDNLLDLIRTFTLFSTNDKGQTIKIVGRYQQFRAVKLAVKRLIEGRNPRERSGIIWHTQGSGKSLTMMFMVREMYRHAQLSNWKVVFITDRTQLEQQLSETSQSIGFTVKLADSIKRLKELLSADTSDLVMAMIHKFREVDLTETFPELNVSPNILVMTDEAHRSQYKLLGANLDKGIPNAAKIGYTGTPIDKTEQVLRRLHRQVHDAPVHQGRRNAGDRLRGPHPQRGGPRSGRDGRGIRGRVQRVQHPAASGHPRVRVRETPISRQSPPSRPRPGTWWSTTSRMCSPTATRRRWWRRHARLPCATRSTWTPRSRRRSQSWGRPTTGKLDLDRLKAMKTDGVISRHHNDLPHLKEYSDSSRHEASIKSFKLAFGSEEDGVNGDLGILIVNNMLLTGFDAPVEQVMYLDKVVVAHNLLQAIARVNRVGGESKDKGFVVDYVGIGHHLKKAIDTYDEREQKEIIDALSFPDEELRELENAHAAVMALFQKHGLTDMSDHDDFYDVFYDEDLRFDFMLAFKRLTKSLNLLFPARQALEFMGDYNALAEINVLAGKHFRDQRLSMKGIPAKLRAITDAHLAPRGIDLKVPPISILDEDFEKGVDEHRRTKNKAAEIEHAIRHHLHVDLDDDPDLRASFAEALTVIFEKFLRNWNKIYEELEKLRTRIINASNEPTYGLHRKKKMPFFRMFQRELFGADKPTVAQSQVAEEQAVYRVDDEDRISYLVDLTQQITLVIERELKLAGFWESIPARNKLKAEIQNILLAPEFSKVPDLIRNRAHLISRVMELSEKNNDTILFAD